MKNVSIQFKPDKETEKRYDREAGQYREYLKQLDTKEYADSASKPLMFVLDAKMAKAGEP